MLWYWCISIWVCLIQNLTSSVNYYLQKHSISNRCKSISKQSLPRNIGSECRDLVVRMEAHMSSIYLEQLTSQQKLFICTLCHYCNIQLSNTLKTNVCIIKLNIPFSKLRSRKKINLFTKVLSENEIRMTFWNISKYSYASWATKLVFNTRNLCY